MTGSQQHAPGSGASAPTVSAVVVLAAGQGTRMRSQLPKVLHPLAGKPLLWHSLRAAAGIGPRSVVAVTGYGREQVEGYLAGADDLRDLPISTAIQAEQRGTGHAVQCALDATGPLTGTVIVTYGDVPLLRSATLADLAAEHVRAGNAVTVLTATVADPTGYGRVVRATDGTVSAIVEHRDADDATRAIDEINTGVYAFDGQLLSESIVELGSNNSQGELYLTDMVDLAVRAGRPVGSVQVADPTETEGVNDRVQLSQLAGVLRARLVRDAQRAGVTFHDPATTYLHADVTIGPDTEILPGTHVEAGTVVGSNCTIGPATVLVACHVDDGASITQSRAEHAHIGAGSRIGPYSHLRTGTVIGENAELGAFVETKNAVIGAGVKAHHLAYLGDSAIGAGANIGAGTITANYDGAGKFTTSIGRHAFIGSNATLVAPVTIADGAYVAAGSTVTSDVPPGDLAVARGGQHNSTAWVLRRRADSAADVAARAAGAQQQSTPGKDD